MIGRFRKMEWPGRAKRGRFVLVNLSLSASGCLIPPETQIVLIALEKCSLPQGASGFRGCCIKYKEKEGRA
jgi:hypothetical protein